MKKKEGVLHKSALSNTLPIITPIASNVITSLDGTSVIFTPNNDGIKREEEEMKGMLLMHCTYLHRYLHLPSSSPSHLTNTVIFISCTSAT